MHPIKRINKLKGGSVKLVSILKNTKKKTNPLIQKMENLTIGKGTPAKKKLEDVELQEIEQLEPMEGGKVINIKKSIKPLKFKL